MNERGADWAPDLPRVGMWALEYVAYDSLENRNPWRIERVELEAASMSEAHGKAVEQWQRIGAEQVQGWDGRSYPHTPCLVFRYYLGRAR